MRAHALSLGFQYNWDNAFEPIYFLLRRVCQTPSLVNSLNNHFPSRALFLISRLWIPSPPWSLGRQTTFHLANLYFFFLSPLAKKISNDNNLNVWEPLLAQGKRKAYIGPYLWVLNWSKLVFRQLSGVYPSSCPDVSATFPQPPSIQHLWVSDNESESPNIS